MTDGLFWRMKCNFGVNPGELMHDEATLSPVHLS